MIRHGSISNYANDNDWAYTESQNLPQPEDAPRPDAEARRAILRATGDTERRIDHTIRYANSLNNPRNQSLHEVARQFWNALGESDDIVIIDPLYVWEDLLYDFGTEYEYEFLCRTFGDIL